MYLDGDRDHFESPPQLGRDGFPNIEPFNDEHTTGRDLKSLLVTPDPDHGSFRQSPNHRSFRRHSPGTPTLKKMCLHPLDNTPPPSASKRAMNQPVGLNIGFDRGLDSFENPQFDFVASNDSPSQPRYLDLNPSPFNTSNLPMSPFSDTNYPVQKSLSSNWQSITSDPGLSIDSSAACNNNGTSSPSPSYEDYGSASSPQRSLSETDNHNYEDFRKNDMRTRAILTNANSPTFSDSGFETRPISCYPNSATSSQGTANTELTSFTIYEDVGFPESDQSTPSKRVLSEPSQTVNRENSIPFDIGYQSQNQQPFASISSTSGQFNTLNEITSPSIHNSKYLTRCISRSSSVKTLGRNIQRAVTPETVQTLKQSGNRYPLGQLQSSRYPGYITLPVEDSECSIVTEPSTERRSISAPVTSASSSTSLDQLHTSQNDLTHNIMLNHRVPKSITFKLTDEWSATRTSKVISEPLPIDNPDFYSQFPAYISPPRKVPNWHESERYRRILAAEMSEKLRERRACAFNRSASVVGSFKPRQNSDPSANASSSSFDIFEDPDEYVTNQRRTREEEDQDDENKENDREDEQLDALA